MRESAGVPHGAKSTRVDRELQMAGCHRFDAIRRGSPVSLTLCCHTLPTLLLPSWIAASEARVLAAYYTCVIIFKISFYSFLSTYVFCLWMKGNKYLNYLSFSWRSIWLKISTYLLHLLTTYPWHATQKILYTNDYDIIVWSRYDLQPKIRPLN